MSTISFLILAGVCLALAALEPVPEVPATFWNDFSAGRARTANFLSGAGGAASSTMGRGVATGIGPHGEAASSTMSRGVATGIGPHGEAASPILGRAEETGVELHEGAISSRYFGDNGSNTGARATALDTNEFGRGSSASIVYGGAGSSTSDRGSATKTVSTGYRGYMGGPGCLGGGHLGGGAGGLGAGYVGRSTGGYHGGGMERGVGSGYIGSGYGGGVGRGFFGGVGALEEEAAIGRGVVGGYGYGGFGNGAVNEYKLGAPYGRDPVYTMRASGPLAMEGIGGYDNFQVRDEFQPEGFGGYGGVYGGGYVGDVVFGPTSELAARQVGSTTGGVRLCPCLV